MGDPTPKDDKRAMLTHYTVAFGTETRFSSFPA
jgi:hypothetical protein